MGFSYEEVGKFGSRRAAEDWAKRNDIDPRDLNMRERGEEVEVGVRRGAGKGSGDDRYNDRHGGRNRGFF